jgi:hypothetical protein
MLVLLLVAVAVAVEWEVATGKSRRSTLVILALQALQAVQPEELLMVMVVLGVQGRRSAMSQVTVRQVVLVMLERQAYLEILVQLDREQPQVFRGRGHWRHVMAQVEQLEIQEQLVILVLGLHLVELAVQHLLRGQHVLAQVEQLVILAQQVMQVLVPHLVMQAVQRLLRGHHVLV